MIRIVVDENIPFIEGILEPYASVEYLSPNEITNKKIREADCLIIRTRTTCNKELLEGTNVRFIASATIGFEHIDTAYCLRKGIRWASAPGCNASAVNQYIAAALASYSIEKNFPLQGKKIGIIGVGKVGTLVAGTAALMGLEPILNDPPRARVEKGLEFSGLDTLLSESDIITLHVPLTSDGPDKTLHMAGRAFFDKLERQVLLINTARGPVANTGALYRAMQSGVVKDVILDVWEGEPFIDRELLQRAFIGTPHIAGYSVEGKAAGTAVAVNEVSRFFGLGLDDWYPANLPCPPGSAITFKDSPNAGEAIKRSILKTYDILADSSRLKGHPEDFEDLRNRYPVRREFTYYTISSAKLESEARIRLKLLGFRL